MNKSNEPIKPDVVHQHTNPNTPAETSLNRLANGDTFSRLVLVCSAITAGIGIFGMIGWEIRLRILTSFGTNYVPMSPIVALAFILLGGTWFLYTRTPNQRFSKICVLASVLFTLLIALLNLIQFFTGAQVGIEEVLVRRVLALNPLLRGAGAMSPITAACFLLTCIAILLLLLFPRRRTAGLSGGLSFIVISANLIILLGYLYRAPLFYGGEVRPIAFPVGVAFVALGVGLIAMAGPSHFPLRLLVEPSVRALLLRSFLLVIFIVALIDGIFYNILSQLKLKITETELQALSAVIYVTAASVIVLQLSRIIGGTIDRAEDGRRQAENALRRSYNELEIRVQERTAELAKANETLQAEIAERMLTEEALKSYAVKLEEANQLKDLFTDIMRHDLLNPAGVIKTMTELKLEDTKDEEMLKALLMMQRNADKLIDMIEIASKYARLESTEKLERKPLDLSEVLGAVIDYFRTDLEKKNMRLENLVKRKCYALANPVLEDVFSNLISNAIKYSPEGRKIEVNILEEDMYCKIYVKDWGYGIKDEDKAKLFTRFQRIEKKGIKGTGLGLAIVKRIVDLHGGRVWIEDNPEGGSVFYVKIPKISG